MKKLLMMAFAAMMAGAALANVKPANIFSDNMVLQRDKVVPVWGTSDAGEEVKVSFAGQEVSAKADDEGRWEVCLQPMAASTNAANLVIASSSSQTTQTVSNVLVGDVWLCSGQSNMEMTFNWGIYDGDEFKKEAAEKYGNIRCVKVTKSRSSYPLSDISVIHSWQSPTTAADGIAGWTATGYFFARKLNQECGVPIGIIDDNWSGRRIEPFIAPCGYTDYQAKDEKYAEEVKKNRDILVKLDPKTEEGRKAYGEYIDGMKRFIAKAELAVAAGRIPEADIPQIQYIEATSQYNAMIAPVVRFPIAGVIWYQGCANGREGNTYTEKTVQLVNGWRKMWGYDFPFYWVQLASYTAKTDDPQGGNGYAKIRDAQRIALKYLEKVGMAVAIDVGNDKDIHPKAKVFVGERLAAWALRDVYGKEVCPSGPLFKAADGLGTDKVTLSFDYTEGGLSAGEKNNLDNSPVKLLPDAKLVGFAVETEKDKWEWADAVIDGDNVVVTAGGKKILNVRYGYRANATGLANLYNKSNSFPASPFATDNQW